MKLRSSRAMMQNSKVHQGNQQKKGFKMFPEEQVHKIFQDVPLYFFFVQKICCSKLSM
jgi:hypothetical protein